jgi:hypothetical protein
MTNDTLALGDMNFETPINSTPTHDEELQVVVHNVERLVDEQEANQAGTEGVSKLSVFGTLISVVFCIILCYCCFCRCYRNCWLQVMRWWYFDENSSKTIVFRLKVVNKFYTSNDDGRRRRLSSVLSTAHVEPDSQGELQEIKYYGPHTQQVTVGKR